MPIYISTFDSSFSQIMNNNIAWSGSGTISVDHLSLHFLETRSGPISYVMASAYLSNGDFYLLMMTRDATGSNLLDDARFTPFGYNLLRVFDAYTPDSTV